MLEIRAATLLCLAILFQVVRVSDAERNNSQEINSVDITDFGLGNMSSEKFNLNNIDENDADTEDGETKLAENTQAVLPYDEKETLAAEESPLDAYQEKSPLDAYQKESAKGEEEIEQTSDTYLGQQEQSDNTAMVIEKQRADSSGEHQEAKKPGHVTEGKPPHAYGPHDFNATKHKGARQLNAQHFGHGPVFSDNTPTGNKLHNLSASPNKMEKVEEDIIKKNSVPHLKNLWERKARENQPISVISLPNLIPSISEHIKCNASGIVTISYPTDIESQSKLSMEEEKLVKSLKKYNKYAHKLPTDVKTQHLVDGKWSMVVSKFFVRAIYRSQKGKKMQKLRKDSVQKLEDLAMQLMVKNVFSKNHNKINYAHLPEVDLQDFAGVEPTSYFKQVPQDCKKKQADFKYLEAKKKDMCHMFYLMVSALSDIVVGDHSLIVCFLNEGSNTWLTETATKLQKLHTEQVLHEQLLNKSIVKDTTLLLQLTNCEWASHFLHRLDDKYKAIKHKMPQNETERRKMDGLHKEIVALKQNVDKYHKNLKEHSDSNTKSEISKKKSELKEVKLEAFFSQHH